MIDVLVIDDEEPLRDLLIRVLVREGYTVEGAANGEDGLNKFRDTPARLVIVDLMMPRMGGTIAIGELRRTDPGLCILAMSGNQTLTSDDAKALGADAMLAKPFRPAEFIAAVRALIGALEGGRPT